MKWIENIRNYSTIIYKVILFLVSIAIIVYLFPKEGKFRYEFQKGKPWLHEDLIAPMDFAILKSDIEIEQQKESILKDFYPYFQFDDKAQTLQFKQFNNHFEDVWKKNIEDFLSQFSDSSEEKTNFDSIKNSYLLFYKSLLDKIYVKGIVSHDEIKELNEKSRLVLVIANHAEEVKVSEVFTPKLAYEYSKDEIEKFAEQNSDTLVEPKLLNQININEFIHPNFSYDEETSNKIKANLTENISVTYGMVQSGERIISKGEVVHDDAYKILESLKKEFESSLGNSSNYYLIIFGQIILIFSTIFILFLFLFNFRKEILYDWHKTFFILLIIILIISLAVLIIKIENISIYIVPFAILPIILRTFYDARLALFIHIISILLIGFLAPNGFEFVFLQFSTGVVAIFTLANNYKRGQLFLSALVVFIAYSVLYLGFAIIQEGNFSAINVYNFAWFAINSLLLLSSYPLIYIFEKLFGFISEQSLMELSDTNSPLLRKLAEDAPGTFQHSIQVANLAEAAIRKIGGNSLLARTGALYHDIGKTQNPQFFIENQTSDINPHKEKSFEESAMIIISHVTEGVRIAKKHRLPAQIIDFIETHHGNSTVQYFYRSFINDNPEEDIDISKFSYPGPIPMSKETVVVMMADSIEAASRSLKKVSEKNLIELIDNIINYQLKEGQYEDADVTFKDISTIKEIFLSKLKNIYHARIEYPKLKKTEVQ